MRPPLREDAAMRGSNGGRLVAAAAAVLGARGVYRLVARGELTLDTGIGRTLQPLGPVPFEIAAPRELVFEGAGG